VRTQAALDWTSTDECAFDLIRALAVDGFWCFSDRYESYQCDVLPTATRARVSVEAGITAPWRLFGGEAGVSIGIDHFNASADCKTLYQQFGITAERVAAAARESPARV